MTAQCPAIGCAVRIDKEAIESLIIALRDRGYEVIGPSVKDGAIIYAPISSLKDLPVGWTAEQQPGNYRLKRRADDALFGYAAAGNSLKSFLHPPDMQVFRAERKDGPFRILPNIEPARRYAFLGVRACELAAAGILDRVLMEGRYTEPIYADRRRNSVIIAVQCTEPAATCFCSSLGTGPRASSGFDLALTEVAAAGSHDFLVEAGTEAGAELLAEVEYAEAAPELLDQGRRMTERAAESMTRGLETIELPEMLRENFDHPHWDNIAGRCFACGNCTQVCPTCFCVTVEDSSDVCGERAERRRKWDSCFTLGFSYIHGGSVRVSTKSRYRHWLTHKLSYWHDQFGSSGCVGCGRCIAWCPAGIDLTAEVAALRAPSSDEQLERGGQ